MNTKQPDALPPAYALMLEKLDEIEHALDQVEVSAIQRLAGDMDQCLAALQLADSQQELAQSTDSRGQQEEDLTRRQTLLETILAKNTLLSERIRCMAALQKNELLQIRIGRETARGYASNRPPHTGSIINSSN